ncbi:YigZ family protein [Sulfobacillus sp. DSM 109850]|uniref:YigZ family protein n=1 Tax=Sulfobacillus harzensis TaxID=2729629 RepID=A0A7Y0L6L7_9FIRM|nr:YigZ family protein [Sulfobacillus harzensis]
MPTVLSSEPAEYLVERSRFIGQTFRLTDPEALAESLEAMKAAYPGANHYTWAYRIDETHLRASDNGEPQGTAGLPMLHILQRQGWEETLVVVVRYFGGIKLGRGGLVHAYQKSAQQALDHTVPGVVKEIRTLQIRIDYASYDRVQHALEPLVTTLDAEFSADVGIRATLEKARWPDVEAALDAAARGSWTCVGTHDALELVPLTDGKTDE